MPWCDPCEKNWTPTSVGSEGTCPSCGHQLEGTPGVIHEPMRTPWHFWVGVVAAGAYLLWRLLEAILAVL